jgi:nicotinamide mononucleotide transporter
MFHWLIENYIEIAGAVTGLIYVYFSIRQNILLWLFGIINAALYIYVFIVAKFYAGTGLQAYYLLISVYGWYNWKYGSRENPADKLPVSRLDKKTGITLLLISIILFTIIALVLKNYTDSPVPLGDSFITSLSITATWMLARKILEHWLVWIIVDTSAIWLYYCRYLYPTVLLYFIFTIMAITGFYQWKKSMNPNLHSSEF